MTTEQMDADPSPRSYETVPVGMTEAERCRAAVLELADALRLTVEYVGTDTLPPLPGWSWFDALSKHAPIMLEGFQGWKHADSIGRRREALAVAAGILRQRLDPERPHKLDDDVRILEELREELGNERAENKSEVTTMAEEPIEDRLRRAFLNGLREGIEMATWRRGQWDFV